MIQKVFVRGVVPSLNELVRGGHTRVKDDRVQRFSPFGRAKKKWTDDVCTRAIAARLKSVPAAHFTFVHFQLSKKLDPDNFTGVAQKVGLDGLKKAGVIPNDGWKQVLGITHYWQTSKDPGFWILIGESLTREEALLAVEPYPLRKVAK